MKRLVIGILAHVDAGKTTLSEGLLYTAGTIKKIGRVDHGDAFLDTNFIERQRGITIFSKQAMLETDTVSFTLLDTPGHVDFSAEMERSLRVMDYAILVINGAEGVQSHTETLWKLLRHYDVPVFIFVNKMDLQYKSEEDILSELSEKLDDKCISFKTKDDTFYENVAMQSSDLLDVFLSGEEIAPELIAKEIAGRNIVPVYFGAALKNEGVVEFFKDLCTYTQHKKFSNEFGAKIFKISEDDKGKRLAYLKITGGSLLVKSTLDGGGWSQKINEIRQYSGIKFSMLQEAMAGSICAIPGLEEAKLGEGLGFEQDDDSLLSQPVLTFGVELPEGADVLKALSFLRKIEEEDSQIHVIWNELVGKIDVQVMGEVQLEVLKEVLLSRFNLPVSFTKGSIIYKETIQSVVEGVGHFEPLRHYAEVHLLLKPGQKGSGLVFNSACPEDDLAKNWQRLILTHLGEKTHKGVLTGSPITDVEITLISGKAHAKHTEGGDFRQATYRAVRQGLMQAESVLLEPWYSFVLEIPNASVGRALIDLERMGAKFSPPDVIDSNSQIKGFAPVSKMREYHTLVTAYSHGLGRLSCSYSGYDICTESEKVISEIGYNAEADVANTPDSVFCTHGAGFTVSWDKVYDYMDLPMFEEKSEAFEPIKTVRQQKEEAFDDDTLLEIYERTYGKVKQKTPGVMRTPKMQTVYKGKALPKGPTYLLVDGYNIIYAWDELSKVAAENLEVARHMLIERLSNYRAMRKCNIIIVFDAYKVKGTFREIEEINGMCIVYTKEAETADAYIEKTSKELAKEYRVRVATSDRLEQIIVFGHGTQRVSASEFLDEVQAAENEMREFIHKNMHK